MIDRISRLMPIAALLLVAACGEGSGEGVGGVSASEARALNEAAEMLDARMPDVDTAAAANGSNAAAPAAGQ